MKKLIFTILIMLITFAFGSGNFEITDEGVKVMSPDGTQVIFLSGEGLGTYENLKDNSLAINTAVYTTAGKLLTTDIPATGTLGFWTRTTGPATLTTATAGDNILTTGTVQAGAVTLTGSDQNYIFTKASNVFQNAFYDDFLAIESQGANLDLIIGLAAKDMDGSENVIFEFWGARTANISDGDLAQFGYVVSPTKAFGIKTFGIGTGTVRPIRLETEGNANQFVAGIDGNNTMSGNLAVGNGSEGTPSFTFISDLDTGIFTNGDNRLGLTVSGTTRLLLSATVASFRVPLELFTLTGPSGIYITAGEIVTTIVPNDVIVGHWNRDNATTTITTGVADDDVELGGDLDVIGLITGAHYRTTSSVIGASSLMSIGNEFTEATAAGSVVIGNGTSAGDKALASGVDSLAIGVNAKATALRSLVVGANSTASGTNAVALGIRTVASALAAVAIGSQAEATAESAIQIGAGTNNVADTTAFGIGGANYLTLSTTTLTSIVSSVFGNNATDTHDLFGITTLGDGGTTNFLQVSATGDLSFKGSGGLLYGNMDQDGGVFTVFLETVNQLYELDADTTNISAGPLNDVTFPGDHYLEVKTAGVYKIDWSLICQISGLTGGSEHVEFEILKNGNATGKGESHVTHKNTARDFPLASTTLLDLAVDDEISIGATARDSSGKTITIDHLEMTIFMVGGT